MEKLQIMNDFENKCCLCERPFKWRMSYNIFEQPLGDKIKSFQLITECPKCRSLIRRKRELQDKLLGVEFEIWNKRIFKQEE
jgi:hypothetical protein